MFLLKKEDVNTNLTSKEYLRWIEIVKEIE